MLHDEMRHDQYSGEHVAGRVREGEEMRRKEKFFKEFRPDSEGSPTKLHEDFRNRDRNK